MLVETGDTARAENRDQIFGNQGKRITCKRLGIWSFFPPRAGPCSSAGRSSSWGSRLCRVSALKGPISQFLVLLLIGGVLSCTLLHGSSGRPRTTGQLTPWELTPFLQACSLTTHDLLGIVLGLHVAIIWGWWMGLGIKVECSVSTFDWQRKARERGQGLQGDQA